VTINLLSIARLESVTFRKNKMNISKLEEGIIEIMVKAGKGSGGRDYDVTGKYISGIAAGCEAFSDSMHQEHNDHDPFSPKEAAALNFRFYAKQRGYIASYHDGKIEVIRKMDGNN